MSDEKYILSLVNAKVGFKAKSKNIVLLENLNLQVKPSELICLVGRNGAGKSTILNCLVNLRELLSGTIYFQNTPLDKIHPFQLAKNISYVSSGIEYTQSMKVMELVCLGRFPYTNWIGTLTKNDFALVSEAIENVGIAHLADRNLGEISDGERQKAMIARTLAQDTPLIIFDEPTAFLDLPSRYDIISLFHDLKIKGKTIIFSTHDLNIAMHFSDKLWLIDNNKIHDGSPEDLIIDRTIAGIFESEKILLNEMTGDFELRKTFSKKLSLAGKNPFIFYWTSQALQRAGYEIVEVDKEIPEIVFEEEKDKIIWKIRRFNENLNFESIYNMLSSLK